MKDDLTKDIILRPRFKLGRDETEEELLAKFKANNDDKNCKYCSKIVDKHIFIDVPKNEDRFWSPQLHLEIVTDFDNKTYVKGLFGPKPQIWTLFMFLHFGVGILFSVFFVMLYVRWTLERDLMFPTIMSIVLPIIWIALYVFGRITRRKGKGQILELQKFMMETLKK